MMGAAISYAERLGFYVFGVADDCRVPIKVKGQYEHGCHDATNDPDEIRRRWTRHPKANIAVACGAGSGVFVLDIDCKGEVDGFASLAQLVAQHGPLPESWLSITPSGGEHHWFRQPGGVQLRNRVGLRVYHADGSRTVYPGLDIRSDGASAAVPPSAKPHGSYTWVRHPLRTSLADAPNWLIDLAKEQPPPPRAPRPPLRITSSDRAARYVERALEGEYRAVAETPKNAGRNLRLFQAAANLGELVAANLLPQDLAEQTLEDAARDCGLLQEDGHHAVRMTIASGMSRGLRNPREISV